MSIPASRLRLLAWDRPEWWSLAMSTVAWVCIVSSPHTMHVHRLGSLSFWLVAMERWILMIVAMMFPLLIEPVRITAARSFWCRRNRAIAGFLIGYFASWIVPGVIATAALILLRRQFAPGWLTACGFVLAAIWQFTRWKRRGLRLCHVTRPLAPGGWRAHADCILYGGTIARGCMLSCGGLMAACTLAGHSVFAMVVATGLAALERATPTPDDLLIGFSLVTCGALFAAVSLR
jgi:hypothetical protein